MSQSLLISVFLSALVLGGCKDSADRQIVARVNGDNITIEAFQSRLREYRMGMNPPMGLTADDMALRKRVLNELIEETVILQEADRRKISVSSEETESALRQITKDYSPEALQELLSQKKMSKARLRQNIAQKLVLERVVQAVTKDVRPPSPAETEAYYKNNADQFRHPERFHVEQIVVKSRQDGERVLAELKKGDNFQDLARAHSFTPEAAQGGTLGNIEKGMLPQALDELLDKLPLGKPSDVIETEYGFHILEVTDRKPEQFETLVDATPGIIKILTDQQRDRQFSAWRQETLGKAKIERNQGLLASAHE